MPTTPEAVELLSAADVLVAPGKAANAGGVARSALEMQQNASRDRWSFAQTEEALRRTMVHIHQRCHDTAVEFGRPGDHVLGANVTGFHRVAEAMIAQGLVWPSPGHGQVVASVPAPPPNRRWVYTPAAAAVAASITNPPW